MTKALHILTDVSRVNRPAVQVGMGKRKFPIPMHDGSICYARGGRQTEEDDGGWDGMACAYSNLPRSFYIHYPVRAAACSFIIIIITTDVTTTTWVQVGIREEIVTILHHDYSSRLFLPCARSLAPNRLSKGPVNIGSNHNVHDETERVDVRSRHLTA